MTTLTTVPEAALIAVLREHGPTVDNDGLRELLPWRESAGLGSPYASERQRFAHFLQLALRRARRAGFGVHAPGGDSHAERAPWVHLHHDPGGEVPALPDSVAAAADALRGTQEATWRELAPHLDEAWEEVVLTAPAGEAAFDLDPDRVVTGFGLMMQMGPSEYRDSVARRVAWVVQQVVTTGTPVAYRFDARWHPVPERSVGGYGLASASYSYRLIRDTWSAAQAAGHHGITETEWVEAVATGQAERRASRWHWAPGPVGVDPATGDPIWDADAVRASERS